MLWIIIAAVTLGNAVEAAEICYNRLGCFTDDVPWGGTEQRPIKKLPWSPEDINTRFLLWTRKNMATFQEITGINPSTIANSNFDRTKKTRFVIHGYIDKGEESWLSDMCKAMFEVEDVNCICVDWVRGSRTLYDQAANNIRVVGAEMAYLIDVLEKTFNYSRSETHIIGHSLGSHAAGETGRRIPGIRRITGLDPAKPFFKNTPIEVRLDISDAIFVDIIHTNGAPLVPYLGFGLIEPIGHLDFYPNGGELMPGCDKNIVSTIIDINGIWEGTRNFAACSHLRSYKYYTESIRTKNGFIGIPCNSYDDFTAGNCFSCPSKGCPLMGHYADTYPLGKDTTEPSFFLNTGAAPTFARWRYQVTVKITCTQSIRGFFSIALYGSNVNTQQYQIAKALLESGKTFAAGIDVEDDIGEIKKVKFIWNNKLPNLFGPKIGAEMITLLRVYDQQTFRFCGTGAAGEDVLQTILPCSFP
ncbi:pancreatic lipase-related protein 2-like [Stegostoma tigrinum]|uniref:pancreatic lipase-related protein 2-like n=1 Tax=Stegostoma tigrinum TaxID=3053191 RepID=UPI00202AEAF0|nr:pancreatic lipase-related protein 2-like [Stegostoma tigrinum]XP_059508893.1 pancreatic lipase-related protein 2-like [Stegostoma tigrinum]